MRDHWSKVVDVVGVLSEVLLSQGATSRIDLAFTQAEAKTSQSQASGIVDFVKEYPPVELDVPGVQQSNPAHAMMQILKTYGENYRKAGQKIQLPGIGAIWETKPLSLYILTDGNYQQHANLEEPIQNIIDMLQELKKEKRHVGIQFIRFGKDAEGKARLEALDQSRDMSWSVCSYGVFCFFAFDIPFELTCGTEIS